MQAITIRDLDDRRILSFDLKDILPLATHTLKPIPDLLPPKDNTLYVFPLNNPKK